MDRAKGKKSLRDESRKSVLYVSERESRSGASTHAMKRLARFAARWPSEKFFQLG